MAGRKQFLLRVDPELWRALERWAADDLRSVNAQVEWLLRDAVRRRRGGSAAARAAGAEGAGASGAGAHPSATLPPADGGAGAAPPGGAAPAPDDTPPD